MLPVKSIQIFTVVGRHLNLVGAADELHLTQSALSKQIKSLEDFLGVRLFERKSRGLKFTEEGEVLYQHLSSAFRAIDEGVGKIAARKGARTLTVTASRGISQRVISRTIPDFMARHPGVNVRINTHRSFSDLNLSGADVSIRLGRGEWEGVAAHKLVDDELIAVASPKVVRNGGIHLSALGEYICLRNSERDYLREWNQHVPDAQRIHDRNATVWFNDSATLLETLDSGCGFTVTRRSLVARDLRAGNLLQLGSTSVDDGLAYYAVVEAGADAAVTADFIAWLKTLWGG
jgi:DNA-binding transcriptional LysR family regulator